MLTVYVVTCEDTFEMVTTVQSVHMRRDDAIAACEALAKEEEAEDLVGFDVLRVQDLSDGTLRGWMARSTSDHDEYMSYEVSEHVVQE